MKARFVVASLGAHALILLVQARPPPPVPVEVVARLRTPPPDPPPPALHPAHERLGSGVRHSKRTSDQLNEQLLTERSVNNLSEGAAPGKPDLFLPGALASVVPSPSPNWGGATRRPGDRSDRDEGAEVAARVQRWLSDDSAAELARSARVPPVWRDVERQIDGGFHPTVEEVTRENGALTAVKQLPVGAKPESGPVPRGTDDSHSVESDARGFAESRAEQVAAAHRAYESPRGWKRVEIESEVDADGRLVLLRVALPSGRHELDRAALAAVKAALERRPPRDGHVMARWAVKAAVATNLPAAGAITDEVSGRAVGGGVGLSFSFDESGHFSVDIPFQRKVNTRVSLVGIRRL